MNKSSQGSKEGGNAGHRGRTSRTNLVIQREEARSKIEEQIFKGIKLLDRDIRSYVFKEDMDAADGEYRRWDDYNRTMLERLFNTGELAAEYSKIHGEAWVATNDARKLAQRFRNKVQDKLTRLESIRDRLGLYEELPSAWGPAAARERALASRKVFVVHGRDEAAKEKVARFLQKLDLTPVILHEEPNAGRTIMEKFEDYSDVGFAVALLSPDDIGGERDPSWQPGVRPPGGGYGGYSATTIPRG